MMTTEPDIAAELLRRTQLHVDRRWLLADDDKLHHAVVTKAQAAHLRASGVTVAEPGLVEPVCLSCGPEVSGVSLPSVIVKGLTPLRPLSRCAGCCRATGVEPGIGSPEFADTDGCAVWE
jgi:hypothetical protein